MKFIKFLVLPVLFLLAMSLSAAAQNVTVNPGAGSYPTLSAAFAAINAGTHTGAITVEINADTVEPTVAAAPSAVLNASGTGAASYTSVLIIPSGAAARTVTGAATAGFPLIELNGADNVTFNGLNTGGNALTISNTTASATSGTSTIRFVGDATNNTVTNSTVLGSFAGSVATNGGNIWFSTAVAGGTGNDGNTISNNNLGPAGANLPTKAIHSIGTTTATANFNSGNTVTANNIFDYFGAAVTSAGIYLAAGTTDWTITNNRFFQTAARTQTVGTVHSAMQTASTNVSNTIFSGNIIGYSSAAGTGVYSFVGFAAASKFLAVNFGSAGPNITITNNTVTAINMSGVLGGTSTTGAFIGIVSASTGSSGPMTGNTVGSTTTAGAITINYAGTASSEIFGIYYFPSTAAVVSNNNVGGFDVTNTSAFNTIIFGIRAFTATTVTNTMQNNVVGSSAAPINLSSAATGSQIVGLYSQSGVPAAITGNIVRNLNNNAPNVGTGTSASVIGLRASTTGTVGGGNVAQNLIHSLANTNTSAAVAVTGLQYDGGNTATNLVQRNFIHSLDLDTTGIGVMRGINITAGTTQFQNNMIRLGIDAAGAPIVGNYDIIGINEQTGTDNIYHNSVYIGGTSGATANTFAFSSNVTVNTRNYLNNIFANDRTSLGGINAAAFYSGTLPAGGLTSNYNIYYSQDPNTAIRNGATNYTLAAWQAASGQDANSIQALSMAQIGFVNPTGNATTVDLHINATSIARDTGVPINAFAEQSIKSIDGGDSPASVMLAPVMNDFDGQIRPLNGAPDIGADEYAPNTAATVTLAGRVTTPDGRGIRNVYVTLTDRNGNVRTAATGSFGYYSFDEVEAGQNVILRALAKRYSFTQSERVIFVEENVDNLNFTAEGSTMPSVMKK